MPGDGSVDEKPGRNLVLLFDGTWNVRTSFTNVARMFEAIDDSESKAGDNDTEQRVKYFKGVGTNRIGHLLGGAIGWGLSDIVKEGYCWLSNNYRKGDKIFVFGFSRGAFSARSLVSLVHRCGGVLKRGGDGKDLEVTSPILHDAYSMYQSYVVKTGKDGIEIKELDAVFSAKKKDFDTKYSGRVLGPVKVKMLGVWDTVGALGIPDGAFNLFNKGILRKIPPPFTKLVGLVDNAFSLLDNAFKLSSKHYAFHDQGLPCIVENAYHALAIDEHRENFQPTLWVNHREPKDPNVKHEVKQVWFVGSHSNVGGGAATGDDDEDPDDLWQYSYIWMQANASTNGLRFYFKHTPGVPWPNDTGRYVSRTKVEDSFGNMAIGQFEIPLWNPLPFLRRYVQVPNLEYYLEVVPSFAKVEAKMGKLSVKGQLCKYSWHHDRTFREINLTNGAKLHWSVVQRLLQDKSYQPKNPTTTRLDGNKEKHLLSELLDWGPDWGPVEDEAVEHQYERPCGLEINTTECTCTPAGQLPGSCHGGLRNTVERPIKVVTNGFLKRAIRG